MAKTVQCEGWKPTTKVEVSTSQGDKSKHETPGLSHSLVGSAKADKDGAATIGVDAPVGVRLLATGKGPDGSPRAIGVYPKGLS